MVAAFAPAGGAKGSDEITCGRAASGAQMTAMPQAIKSALLPKLGVAVPIIASFTVRGAILIDDPAESCQANASTSTPQKIRPSPPICIGPNASPKTKCPTSAETT